MWHCGAKEAGLTGAGTQVWGSEEGNGNLLFTPLQSTFYSLPLGAPDHRSHSLPQILAAQTFTPAQNFWIYHHHLERKKSIEKYIFPCIIEKKLHVLHLPLLPTSLSKGNIRAQEIHYSFSPDKMAMVPTDSQHTLGENYGGFESTFDGLSLVNHALRITE